MKRFEIVYELPPLRQLFVTYIRAETRNTAITKFEHENKRAKVKGVIEEANS